jgi:hypothetical protein
VLTTEAVVAGLCQGQPTPSTVRVDSLPSAEVKAGTLGRPLAASIVEGLSAGGRRYEGGRLVRAALGGGAQRITLPDGQVLRVGNVPHGDLHAAWIASGAPWVTATSGEAPAGLAARAVLPLARALVAVPPLRHATACPGPPQAPPAPPAPLPGTRRDQLAGRHHPGRVAARGRCE